MEYKIRDATEELGGTFTVLVIVLDGNQLGRAIDAIRGTTGIQECCLTTATFQKGNWQVEFRVRVREGVGALAVALVLEPKLKDTLYRQLTRPRFEEELFPGIT